MPYWLKGGLIGLTISIVSFLILYILPMSEYGKSILNIGPLIKIISFDSVIPIRLGVIIGFIAYPVTSGGFWFIWGDSLPSILAGWIGLILGWIVVFVIGAVIGLCYGKIKEMVRK